MEHKNKQPPEKIESLPIHSIDYKRKRKRRMGGNPGEC